MKRQIHRMAPLGRAALPAGSASGRHGSESRGTQAFTLLEVLVAVAALALLAVGVAAIFDTTGKTVQAGRRVSTFSSYAAMIEQQLRQDIASMTRDGFLVIRNQHADVNANGEIDDPDYLGGSPPVPFPANTRDDRVAAFPGDPNPRVRRVDELLFFAKGEFRSARELMAPGFVAESDTARIYYGHGRRRQWDPEASISPYWRRPELDDTFENESNTWLGARFDDNPNRYASEWILLRHVTLLRQPRNTALVLPTLPYNLTDQQAADSDIQIALQPAASNIFRALSVLFPDPPPNAAVRNPNLRPAFASGIVDIATTDLREIRSVVETARWDPANLDLQFFDPLSNDGPDNSNPGVDGQRRIWTDSDRPDGDPEIIRQMQSWMDEAFPANSMGRGNGLTRIRCEPAATDYVGVEASGLSYPEKAYRRADQLMLSNSNFFPRCTEFIVEWSLGTTIPNNLGTAHPLYGRRGEVIWYGMERQVGGQLVAAPYAGSHVFPNPNNPQLTEPWRQPIHVPYTRVDGAVRMRSVPQSAWMLHRFYDTAGQQPNRQSISSYFGWVDPTFDPEYPDNPGLASGPHNGKLDLAAESAAPAIEWPWPKMIRITMTLADPRDPSIEQTFQFVFDVPAGHARR